MSTPLSSSQSYSAFLSNSSSQDGTQAISEDLNQQILDSSDDCIKVLDLEGRILFMSQGGQTLLKIQNITPFLKTAWIEFWEGADQQAAIEAISRARSGEIFTFQGYRPTLTGEPKWWDIKVSPIRGASGQVERLLCVSRDITERMRIENERKQAEKHLSAIFSKALVGLSEISLNGQFLRVNDELCRVLGRSRQELLAMRVVDVTHPDDVSKNLEAFGTLVQTGEPVSIDKRYLRPDGTIVWANSSLTRLNDDQGRPSAVLAVTVDLTDRKQAEVEREKLLANERNYANQLQGLTTAALAINSALSVEEVLQIITNQAALIIRAHQSVASLTIDQNWAQAITATHLSDKYAQWRNYDEKPDGSGIYAYICHLNRPMRMTQAELEAHPRWKGFGKAADKHPPMRGWLAAPLVGRDGKNIGLLQLSDKYEGEFTDADESILVQLAQMASVAIENAQLYEAEQQARSTAEAAREEAQSANRVKDEFLAVLSHELRSPLNPILGWTKLLQAGRLDPAKTKQALATIERNAKLQTELIQDLLDVSRILRGKLSLNVRPVDLVLVVEAAIETVRLAAEAKAIKIQTILDCDSGHVTGDSSRLQQVVWNLVSNAVKFTSPGGQVKVHLSCEGDQAQITVTDTGKGIHPEFLPYVFDYFRQEDGATTRKFGGLGLGLAIVRHLVELHGGTVEVDSPGEGQGATFTVKLPTSTKREQINSELRSSLTDYSLSGVRVLVVDDDLDMRDIITFSLQQADAEVVTVASAAKAVEALAQFQPDVLVSDIGMPEIDGYMLLRQIRSMPPEQGGRVPAIALTAYAAEFDQKQALKAGFQRHLSKPIEPDIGSYAVLVKLKDRLALANDSSQEEQ